MSARNVGHSSEIPFVIPDRIEPTPIHLATMHIWLGADTQTKTMASALNHYSALLEAR